MFLGSLFYWCTLPHITQLVLAIPALLFIPCYQLTFSIQLEGHAIGLLPTCPRTLKLLYGLISGSSRTDTRLTRTIQNSLPKATSPTLVLGSWLSTLPKATFLFGYLVLFKKISVETFIDAQTLLAWSASRHDCGGLLLS